MATTAPRKTCPRPLSRNKLLLISWLVPAFVLDAWELAVRSGISPSMLPAPSKVAAAASA